VFRRRPLDRNEVLARADRARGRGRVEEAVRGYRELLARDPEDATAKARLAPLLARTGETAEAAARYRALAEEQRRAGFVDRAAALLRQAAEQLPDEPALVDELADLQIARGRPADAVEALLDGGRRLAGTRLRPEGVKQVRRALGLAPWHLEGTLLYARLLVLDRRRRDAGRLLDALAERTHGEGRRRARAAAFRLAPSPRRLWRWVRGAR
jgi:tetratricopeptide (TPR) repeat protein